jgi:hypothetical protein
MYGTWCTARAYPDLCKFVTTQCFNIQYRHRRYSQLRMSQLNCAASIRIPVLVIILNRRKVRVTWCEEKQDGRSRTSPGSAKLPCITHCSYSRRVRGKHSYARTCTSAHIVCICEGCFCSLYMQEFRPPGSMICVAALFAVRAWGCS